MATEKEKIKKAMKIMATLEEIGLVDDIYKLEKETRALEKCLRTLKKQQAEIENIKNRIEKITTRFTKYNMKQMSISISGSLVEGENNGK